MNMSVEAKEDMDQAPAAAGGQVRASKRCWKKAASDVRLSSSWRDPFQAAHQASWILVRSYAASA